MQKTEIAKHLALNINIENYKLHINNNMYDYDYHKGVTFHIDKLSENLIKVAETDFKIAEESIQAKLLLNKPTQGDFFRVNGKLFRISQFITDKEFQYSINGSFYLSQDGSCSYSGGFDFSEGSRFNIDDLEITEEKVKGIFWFFSNNNVRAHNGVYFKMDFKVWKLKNESN
jgi:hypothetical protein